MTGEREEKREAPPKEIPFPKFTASIALFSAVAIGAILLQPSKDSTLPKGSAIWYPLVLFSTPLAILLLWRMTKLREGNFRSVKLGILIGIAETLLIAGAVKLVLILNPKWEQFAGLSWSKVFLLAAMGASVGASLGILIDSKEKAKKLAPLATATLALIGGIEGLTGYLLAFQPYPQLEHWFSWLAAGALMAVLPISITSALLVGLRGYWWWAFTAAAITIGTGLSIGALTGFIAGKIGHLLGATWNSPAQWYLFGALTNFQIAALAWALILWNQFLAQRSSQ